MSGGCGQCGQLANDGELTTLPTALLLRACRAHRPEPEDHNKHRSTRYSFWGQPLSVMGLVVGFSSGRHTKREKQSRSTPLLVGLHDGIGFSSLDSHLNDLLFIHLLCCDGPGLAQLDLRDTSWEKSSPNKSNSDQVHRSYSLSYSSSPTAPNHSFLPSSPGSSRAM
jgi:hypothetical protein